MNKKPYIKKQLHELLYQSLETERGGIKIYEAALSSVQNKDMKGEWEEYLEQTRTHEEVLPKVFEERELIGHLAGHEQGEETGALGIAFEAVEQEEDHHLYHTKGLTRELWIESLDFPAVLPTAEEMKNVETAIGAARAENQHDDMLSSQL